MATTGPSGSVVGLLHAALNKPLYYRCLDISKILEEFSLKELHAVLPLLLDSIFGFNNQLGWGLGRLTRHHSTDFYSVRRLLYPDGPLIRLVHRLLADPYFRYEFPLPCIPAPSRRSLEEGIVLPFFAEKLQYPQGHGHGRPYNMLTLNAFEYYFFHFSYFMVNPASQRQGNWSNVSEGLYAVLLEDYLNYYFPRDGKFVPSMPHSPQPVRSPLHHVSPHTPGHRQSPGNIGWSSPKGTSPVGGRMHNSGLGSGILRHGVSSPGHHGHRTLQNSPPTYMSLPAMEQETWRSQTFMQILVEFWLNRCSVGRERLNFKPSIMQSFLPSPDHVRVVRMLVKHVHYFVNSGNIHTMSPWDQLKRNLLPQMFQKKIYVFLKHCFERWPLDSSFRLVLETWLSYIQPWRYTFESLRTQEYEMESREKMVDIKWLGFVTENLLFYSQLFQDFLPRAFRMDLVAPKNAYMLFRVTKVFNLPNLRALLDKAETLFFEGVSHQSHLVMSELGGSFLSSSPLHTNHVAAMNLQMTELEGPGYQYSRLFSEKTKHLLYELLGVLATAKLSAQNSSQKYENEDNSFWSWLGFGSGIDYNTSYVYPDSFDDFGGGGDIRKLEVHLDHARDNICQMFDLPAPEIGRRSVTWGKINQTPDQPENLAPDVIDGEYGPKLTPLGRYQLMNGLRKFDIQYQGDPDLQPIRSFESAVLVRMLYHISSAINERFQEQMAELYYLEGFKGCFFRHYLHGPASARMSPGKKPMPVSPERREWEQTPRISLRWLASYRTMAYFGALFLLLNLWCGLSLSGYLLLMLLVLFGYGFVGAVFKSASKRVHIGRSSPSPYRKGIGTSEVHTGRYSPVMSSPDFLQATAEMDD